MRVMVLVKANKDSEAGKLPGPEILEKMGKFKRGAVEGRDHARGRGLHAAPRQARAILRKGKAVTDGPFAETKELVAGFWLWQVRSMDEAVSG